MSEIRLTLYPTRAYDANTVMRLMLSDASYGQPNKDIANILRATQGINNYFDTYSPDPKRKRSGPSISPNMNMER